MPTLLLFEPDRSRVPQLVFMLKLAGFKCTVAVTFEECLNWLQASGLLNVKFDLLILSGTAPTAEELQQLAETARLNAVATVCIRGRHQRAATMIRERGVTWCRPKELIQCVKEELATMPGGSPRENAL